MPDSVSIKIPQSYESLLVKDITVSHYPEKTPEATQVVVVTLNRPRQGNAFTVQMMRDFELIYPMFDLDERVKCVVVTGAGKMFCAGADLEIGFPGGGERERLVDHRDRYGCHGRTAIADSLSLTVAVASTSAFTVAENQPLSP